MSQQNAGGPKFKIVFAPGAGVSGTPVKKGRGRPPNARPNDLEQAVNSITYVDGGGKDVRKGPNMEKIVFLPKYVQKKVTVIRDSPKFVQAPRKMKAQTMPVPQKLVNSPMNMQAAKKRRLGDLAMQPFAPSKKLETFAEAVEPAESPNLLCRICGTLIEDVIVSLIDDSGALTGMGNKLKAIVDTDITDSPLYPPACCKPCSFKINVCFNLKIELKASDEAVRCTYADLQEGDLVNPSSHIYTCAECQQEVIGMKDFIAHCEKHIQAKTLGTIEPKRKVKEEETSEDVLSRAQAFLETDVDDGSVLFQNEAGELVCEKCGRTFKYRFLLMLHRKAPKRGPIRDPSPPSKQCFVCKQSRVSTVSCKLGDSTIPLCQPCRANVSFMVV